MKLLLVLVVILGCGKKADEADRWPEVVKLATPLVTAADGALLDRALGRIEGDDVPELALEDAIAWRKANGGLPWRDGRTMEDRRPMKAFQLGKALLERRGPADTETFHTVQYLAHRMRAEAPAMIDVMVGFALAERIIETKYATRPELAPTDAELRRSIAADAVFTLGMLDSEKFDESIAASTRRQFAKIVLDAPKEREAFVKHVETAVETAQSDEVMSLLLAPRVPGLLRDQYKVIDAYR